MRNTDFSYAGCIERPREVKMPSVDVVSIVDMQILDNVINNVSREISTRYDFKNVKSEVVLDRKEKNIHVSTGDELKIKAISEMLQTQCIRFKIDPKCLDFKKIEPTSGGTVKRDVGIKEGIPKETSQKMVKFIKSLNLKVQPAVQDDQIRITGKQIDDLQKIMQLLKEQNYDIPLQFVNMKR
jgi:cyclic-di-GMP-binding protein